MSNVIRWLVEAFNPCIHMDRTVATMFDDPANPKVTTVIAECEVCGRTERKVFKAEGACVHKWITDRRSAVYESHEGEDKRPIYHRLDQHCEYCGDVRAIDLKPEGWREKKPEGK
jgi:hypothetical protein